MPTELPRPAEPRLERMLALCHAKVPGLRIVEKANVAWMRALGVVLRPITPDFDTAYTTVMGRTIYLPKPMSEFHPGSLAATLAHELVHQLDMQEHGAFFYISYVAAPLPAGRTMRAYWERRAYAVDLMIANERGGEEAVRKRAGWIARQFSGSSYAWMWAGKTSARAFLEPVVDEVLAGTLQQDEPYAEILAAWRGE